MVRLRGINLPANARLRIGDLTLQGVLTTEDPYQVLTVTVPAAALAAPGDLLLAVDDPDNPAEDPSNAVRLKGQ